MATPIEVLDTAVKIGLGAGITAVSGLVITQLTHRTQVTRERLSRRRELLESVAQEIQTFTAAYLDFWAYQGSLARAATNPAGPTQKLVSLAEEAGAALFRAFSSLTSAEAKLLLLGETETQMRVREMGEHVRPFFSKIKQGQVLTEAQVQTERETLLADRGRVFDALSAAYAKDAA